MHFLARLAFVLALLLGVAAPALTEAPPKLPQGMSQADFDKLVTAISREVLQKLREQGVKAGDTPAAETKPAPTTRAVFQRMGATLSAFPVFLRQIGILGAQLDDASGHSAFVFILLLVAAIIAALAIEWLVRTALSRLRTFKQLQMLRIATRDLAGLAPMPELAAEISDVAEISIDGVYRILRNQFRQRFGDPWHRDARGAWQPTEFCVLGMGKLGGQELNYSSDIDLIFVHAEEGSVCREPPRGEPATRGFRSHQFFQRLIEALVAELTRLAPEGMLYRVDLRLRPEGDSGPLSRSLASYENYYAQWG